MRIAIVLLILAACTDPGDEEARLQERLRDLEAKNEVTCGGGAFDCYMNADAAAACMNDALVSGVRASLSNRSQDSKGFLYSQYDFTVDHQVFEYLVQNGSETSSDTMTFESMCSGTFHTLGPCVTGGKLIYCQ
jgi:hypothetical protein